MSKVYGIYDIRDYIIPQGKIKELHKYLENYIFLEKRQLTDIIEKFYGTAISANNVQIIALLNLFVRENNIKINRLNVLKEIFYADCRHEHSQAYKYGRLMQFCGFDEMEEVYIKKYWSMFVK